LVLIVTLVQFFVGDWHAYEVAKTQPTKLAAMESHWETMDGAPIYLLSVPNEREEKNSIEAFPIPKLLSLLATHKINGTVQGLKDFPQDERPPVLLTFLSFRLMVMFSVIFIILAILAYYYAKKDILDSKRWFLKLLIFFIPIPYIIGELGWTVAEVGRQPWIVYGLLKTSDAISTSVTSSQVLMSLIGFTVFYGTLAIIDIYLLTKMLKKVLNKKGGKYGIRNLSNYMVCTVGSFMGSLFYVRRF